MASDIGDKPSLHCGAAEESAATPGAGAASSNVDLAVRGLLIIAIVFGHSRLLFETLPYYFAALYFWHVQGFFFLAYDRRGGMAGVRIADRLVRYLVPYLFIVGGLAAVRLAVGPHDMNHAVASATAILAGTARLLHAAIGLSLFWFLPALAGFTTALILIARVDARWPGAAFWVGVSIFLAFPLSVMAPPSLLIYLPLGLGVLGYLMALSICHAAMMSVVSGKFGAVARVGGWVAVAAILIAEAVAIVKGSSVNISVFVFAKPPALWLAVLNGSATVAANIVTFNLARVLKQAALLRSIGRRSLDIFLFHQFALSPATVGLRHFWPHPTPLMAVAGGIGAAAIALAFGFAISLILDRLPAIRRLVFPKDLPSFLAALPGVPRANRPAV